jgi:hypothetical protein
MKRNLSLLLLILISTVSFAEKRFQDNVYLKNGSIITGEIIEQNPEHPVKVETEDGLVLTFETDEVLKLIKASEKKASGSMYSGGVEFAYQFANHGSDWLKANVTRGIKLDQSTSIGLGVGFRYLLEDEVAYVPILADFRTSFLTEPVSPYISFNVGYSFEATSDFGKVGFMYNPSLGIRFKNAKESAIYLGVNYEYQNLNYTNADGFDYFDALGITFGVTF